MLGLVATSQLLIAMAGQKGTAMCPTQHPVGFVLFLRMPFALASLPA